MLVIVASCHCIQFQGKLMILIQTQENDEKSHFGPGPKFGSQKKKNFFFSSKIWLRQSLDTMVRYHHAQYQIKLMIQS